MTDKDFTGPSQPCVGTPLYFSARGILGRESVCVRVYFRSSQVSTIQGGILVVVANNQGFNHACLPCELDRIED